MNVCDINPQKHYTYKFRSMYKNQKNWCHISNCNISQLSGTYRRDYKQGNALRRPPVILGLLHQKNTGQNACLWFDSKHKTHHKKCKAG